MTTYYTYHGDGKVTSSTSKNPPIIDPSALNYYHEIGDVVGAYLASRSLGNPDYGCSSGAYQDTGGNAPYMSRQGSGNDTLSTSSGTTYYDSYSEANQQSSSHAVDLGFPQAPQFPQRDFSFPNPERIRRFHTLHALLPHLDPARRLAARDGKVVDVLEQDTNRVFAWQVPKKMLILYLGRSVVNKYIRTLQRADDIRWHGPPVLQELHLPLNVSSQVAWKILLSWMILASQIPDFRNISQLQIPRSTFAACSLAQTLTILGLHRDAMRVESEIARNHFFRPIYADELEALWHGLGGNGKSNNKFLHKAIMVVGQRWRERDASEVGRQERLWDEMDRLMSRNQELARRVICPEENEKFKPVEGREWFANIGMDDS